MPNRTRPKVSSAATGSGGFKRTLETQLDGAQQQDVPPATPAPDPAPMTTPYSGTRTQFPDEDSPVHELPTDAQLAESRHRAERILEAAAARARIAEAELEAELRDAEAAETARKVQEARSLRLHNEQLRALADARLQAEREEELRNAGARRPASEPERILRSRRAHPYCFVVNQDVILRRPNFECDVSAIVVQCVPDVSGDYRKAMYTVKLQSGEPISAPQPGSRLLPAMGEYQYGFIGQGAHRSPVIFRDRPDEHGMVQCFEYTPADETSDGPTVAAYHEIDAVLASDISRYAWLPDTQPEATPMSFRESRTQSAPLASVGHGRFIHSQIDIEYESEQADDPHAPWQCKRLDGSSAAAFAEGSPVAYLSGGRHVGGIVQGVARGEHFQPIFRILTDQGLQVEVQWYDVRPASSADPPERMSRLACELNRLVLAESHTVSTDLYQVVQSINTGARSRSTVMFHEVCDRLGGIVFFDLGVTEVGDIKKPVGVDSRVMPFKPMSEFHSLQQRAEFSDNVMALLGGANDTIIDFLYAVKHRRLVVRPTERKDGESTTGNRMPDVSLQAVLTAVTKESDRKRGKHVDGFLPLANSSSLTLAVGRREARLRTEYPSNRGGACWSQMYFVCTQSELNMVFMFLGRVLRRTIDQKTYASFCRHPNDHPLSIIYELHRVTGTDNTLSKRRNEIQRQALRDRDVGEGFRQWYNATQQWAALYHIVNEGRELHASPADEAEWMLSAQRTNYSGPELDKITEKLTERMEYTEDNRANPTAVLRMLEDMKDLEVVPGYAASAVREPAGSRDHTGKPKPAAANDSDALALKAKQLRANIRELHAYAKGTRQLEGLDALLRALRQTMSCVCNLQSRCSWCHQPFKKHPTAVTKASQCVNKAACCGARSGSPHDADCYKFQQVDNSSFSRAYGAFVDADTMDIMCEEHVWPARAPTSPRVPAMRAEAECDRDGDRDDDRAFLREQLAAFKAELAPWLRQDQPEVAAQFRSELATGECDIRPATAYDDSDQFTDDELPQPDLSRAYEDAAKISNRREVDAFLASISTGNAGASSGDANHDDIDEAFASPPESPRFDS